MSPTKQLHLYILDDLEVGKFSRLRGLLKQNSNVQLLSPAEALAKLARSPSKQPYPLTFGLGRSGEEAAALLQRQTGWFPRIARLDITRLEIAEGRYELVGNFAAALRRFGVDQDDPVALVDDTVYSGQTVQTVLDAFPWQPRITLYCLQGIASSLKLLGKTIQVRCAFPVEGVRDQEVSLIRLSGLFRPGSIRPKHGRELAFFQRPAWMQLWFPQNYPAVTDYCAQLYLDSLRADSSPAAAGRLALA